MCFPIREKFTSTEFLQKYSHITVILLKTVQKVKFTGDLLSMKLHGAVEASGPNARNGETELSDHESI